MQIFLRSFLCAASLVPYAVAAKQAPPNLILLTLDTVRADRMGFLGSQQGLTPNLDALAGQSIVFTRTYSQVPLTNPSHATILTGTYPQFHHVNDFAVPLATELPDLAEILHEHGYRTAAFVGSSVLDAKAGLAPGFDRGFDNYDAAIGERRPGKEVLQHAVAWLRDRREGPFFLWIHLYDPHAPYEPPEPFRSRFGPERYNGAIAYTDSVVGSLLTELRARDLYNHTLIAVMADHGEAFGEHGEREHGIFLYDETIHVPLLFKLPDKRYRGVPIDTRVGLVDVAPTILEALLLPVPGEMQGQSLVPLFNLDHAKARVAKMEATGRAIFSETDYPHLAFGWSSLRAWRSGKYLFIDAPRKELYDESTDPKAKRNLLSSVPAVAATLNAQLDDFGRGTSTLSRAPRATANTGLSQNLAALGYVESNGSPLAKAAIEPRGADPKDKIEVANKLVEALMLEEQKRFQEEIPLIEYVLSREPDHVVANLAYGRALVSLDDFKHAAPALQKALASHSPQADTAMTHYLLGIALFKSEAWEESTREFASAISKSPRWAEAHYSLGAAYQHTEHVSEARKEFETTLEIQPDHYHANVDLALILLTTDHNPDAALLRLKKACETAPKSREVHLYLARVYSQLGQESDANRERAVAARLTPSDVP